MFLGLSGLARFAFAGDHDGTDAGVVQVVLDALLAIAAVGGDGPRLASGAALDALDRRGQLRGIRWVALFQVVVDDDAVVVVDDLGLVAELDRLTELTFGDRSGIRIVQADPAGRASRGDARQALPGLFGHAPGDVQQFGEVVDRAAQPTAAPARGRVLPASLRELLSLALRLIAALGAAKPQLRGDPVRTLARGAAPVPKMRAGRATGGIRRPVTAIRRTALASRPESVG